MNDLLLNFHFLRPIWLLAIIPAIVVGVACLRQQMVSGQWKDIVHPNLLPFLIDGELESSKRWPIILATAIAIITSFALAGPVWKKIPQPIVEDVSGLVIVWDLSPSMNAQDIKPSRLVRSRLKIIDLLHKRKEGTTGLIVYSGESHVASPLTDDNNTVINLMEGLSPEVMPLNGSNTEMAFGQAIELLNNAGVTDGSIVFVTDGIDPSAFDTMEELSSKISHKVTLWSVGTQEGAPIPLSNGGFARSRSGDVILARINDEELQDLAAKIDGLYVPFSNDETDILTIASYGFKNSSNQVKESLKEFDQWHEEGIYLVLFILPLFALAFRRGWLICACIFFVSTAPEKSYAFEWNDLWTTQDQQGMELLENGDVEAAAEQFDNETWKSIAKYRSGDYEGAEQGFSEDNSPSALLNRGNAQVHQKKFDEAIESFKKAVELDPNFIAAKDNLKITKALKKIEEEQENNSDQQSSDEQNSDQENADQDSSDQQNSQNNEQGKQGQQSDSDSQSNSENDPNSSSSENSDDSSENNSSDQQPSQDELSEERKKAMEDAYRSKPDEESSSSENAQPEENENSEEDQQALKDSDAPAEDSEPPSQETLAEQQKEPSRQRDSAPQSLQPGENQSEPVGELTELEQAKEQWLRKIPDDPGGLLRKKFDYEYQKRKSEMRQRVWQSPENNADERW